MSKVIRIHDHGVQHDDHCKIFFASTWWRIRKVEPGPVLIATTIQGLRYEAEIDLSGANLKGYCDMAAYYLENYLSPGVTMDYGGLI